MRPRLRGCLVGAVVAGGLCLAGVALGLPGGEEQAEPEPRTSMTEIVDERRLDERRMELTIRSDALAATTKVRLLLPRGWESRTDWPVLWLSHGGLDDHTSWTTRTDVEALTSDTGVLVVMPDGGRCGSYSDWWNGGAGGPPRWETYHLKELLPLLEARYRAGGRRAQSHFLAAGAAPGLSPAHVRDRRPPGQLTRFTRESHRARRSAASGRHSSMTPSAEAT
ncbi:alpha/beta hydrolase [Nonomuraea insulae]|uniref:Alpha/beta hydrolase n=1 Tax=Nonomuraea insulae TaxID=1616787 RepID=A0ABW1CWS6_9ACTN